MKLGIPIVLAAVLVSSPALAYEVYFNGVKVTGLRSQSFEGCAVRFDNKGNVHITAKGYTVKRVEQADTPKAGSKKKVNNLAQRYYLVGSGKKPQLSQYDVDVFINGKWVRKIRASDPQVVMEITGHLKKGKNLVNFTATKNYRGKSRATKSADVYLRVLLGVGAMGGGTVTISQPLADFRASADKIANFGKATTITVK
jgi:hypothetical protein